MHNNVFRLYVFATLTLAVYACGGKGEAGKDNVPEPYIQSIITDYDGKAVAGKPVTLMGLNFSSVSSENKVMYGVGLDAVSLSVDVATEESLVFTAPEVGRDQIKIRVNTRGKESNQVLLTYTEAPVEDEPWSDVPTLDFNKLGGTTMTIVPGVEWTTFHGTWEGQMRNINIVRTTLNEHNSLGLFYNYSTESGLINLDQKCVFLNAVAGTNGPMACCHFVRVDGVVMRIAREIEEMYNANCAMTIDDGNVVDIVKVKDNFAAAKLPNKTVGVAGPLLVWEGKIQSYPEEATSDGLKGLHPRTAIGFSKDGKTVVQVAVDGRWDSGEAEKRAIGMSTSLLSQLMKGLGCYKAMNFDGGGGTAMWVYGQGDNGIVNHPCDGRVWEEPQAHLRACGNAVYIKSDLKK